MTLATLAVVAAAIVCGYLLGRYHQRRRLDEFLAKFLAKFPERFADEFSKRLAEMDKTSRRLDEAREQTAPPNFPEMN